AHEPETIYVVPIKSDSEHYPPGSRLRVYRSRAGGNEWEGLTRGLPQRNCYVNVLRHDISVGSLERCGICFGRTGGKVYAARDEVEARYPMLRGTMRDHVTQLRRPLVRFFACGEDLSHESPDARLPEAIAKGSEPFVIIGAIAGG